MVETLLPIIEFFFNFFFSVCVLMVGGFMVLEFVTCLVSAFIWKFMPGLWERLTVEQQAAGDNHLLYPPTMTVKIEPGTASRAIHSLYFAIAATVGLLAPVPLRGWLNTMTEVSFSPSVFLIVLSLFFIVLDIVMLKRRFQLNYGVTITISLLHSTLIIGGLTAAVLLSAHIGD